MLTTKEKITINLNSNILKKYNYVLIYFIQDPHLYHNLCNQYIIKDVNSTLYLNLVHVSMYRYKAQH